MRLLLKTMSYGLTHIVVATAVAYALTGDLLVAFSIGLIEPIVQTFVFAGHDWLWERENLPISKNMHKSHDHLYHQYIRTLQTN